VAVVSVYGTLDLTSAARLTVALRDCLAEAPSALIVDAAHLAVTSDEAVTPLVTLAAEARIWPAASIMVACASDEVSERIRRVRKGDDLEMYGGVEEATAMALSLPVPPRRTLTLSPSSTAPARSRQFAHDTCAEWGVERIASLAELVASELVTNGVMHARTTLYLTLRMSDDTLTVALRDGDPRPMYRPDPSGRPADEHGRGLLLLDAMADAWGSSPTADGKVVWANIGVRKSRRRYAPET
jgi:hypothetical protein